MISVGRLALKESIIQNSGDPAVDGIVQDTLSKTSAMATRTLSGGEMGCFAGNREGRLQCDEAPSERITVAIADELDK